MMWWERILPKKNRLDSTVKEDARIRDNDNGYSILFKQYINNYRSASLNRIGVMVAVNFNNSIHIGWSKCCKKDKFNKDFGTMVAINRALSGKFSKIPDSIKDDIERFTLRVKEYEERKNVKCEAIEVVRGG